MPVRLDADPSLPTPTFPAAGVARRPAADDPADRYHDLATGLVRVLDDDGTAIGPWDPGLAAEELRRGLRHLLTVRELDRRLIAAQRQGTTSFYIQSTGEEAIACGFRAEQRPGDMSFPTYRQQGLLVAAGYPLVDMVAQVLSNERDPLHGRQLPGFYSSREHGFFSISGNLGTQFVQAVGWAMAAASRDDDAVAAAWVGDGATAESDFHAALVFASTYRPPVVLNVVNNQWAISTPESIARGQSPTFAVRALAFGIPALRVDGNDYLAVRATAAWAIQRARAGQGPTLIEWVTYRVAAHSTSDDPTAYRSRDEPATWPLGDPIERLRLHLAGHAGWSDDQHEELVADVAREVADAVAEGVSHGTMLDGRIPSPKHLFDDVYAEMPAHLRRQRHEAGY